MFSHVASFISVTDLRVACLAWWKTSSQTMLFKKWSMLPKRLKGNSLFLKSDLTSQRSRSTRTVNTSWPNLKSTWSNLVSSTRRLALRCYDKVIPPGVPSYLWENVKGRPHVGRCLATGLHCVQRSYSSIFLRYGTVFIAYSEWLCWVYI